MDFPRFSRIKKDLHFKSLPKKEIKFKINKRSNAIFKDQKFSNKTQIRCLWRQKKYENMIKNFKTIMNKMSRNKNKKGLKNIQKNHKIRRQYLIRRCFISFRFS